jgi:hypothetical protein
MSEITSNWATIDLDKEYSWSAFPCARQNAARDGWPLSDDYSLPQRLLIASQLQRYPTLWQPVSSICPKEIPERPQSQSSAEFEEQKKAFLRIPTGQLVQYRNEFIVSRDGHIVDHDEDLSALTNRFFSRSGSVPVYITRVGGPLQVTLRTPPRRR